jgi:hypothetical protein
MRSQSDTLNVFHVSCSSTQHIERMEKSAISTKKKTFKTKSMLKCKIKKIII